MGWAGGSSLLISVLEAIEPLLEQSEKEESDIAYYSLHPEAKDA